MRLDAKGKVADMIRRAKAEKKAIREKKQLEKLNLNKTKKCLK
jgi:hypothetical protein